MRGVPSQNLNVKTAEKLFKRKAHPDTKLSAKEFIKKKLKIGSNDNKVFHSSAGTKNAGMYHSGVMMKKVAKKMPSNISSDGMALVPKPGLQQGIMNKKKDAEDIKKLDRKLKGFKYGVGVGP